MLTALVAFFRRLKVMEKPRETVTEDIFASPDETFEAAFAVEH